MREMYERHHVDWEVSDVQLEAERHPNGPIIRKEARLTLIGDEFPDELVLEIQGTPIRFERVSDGDGKAHYEGRGPAEQGNG